MLEDKRLAIPHDDRRVLRRRILPRPHRPRRAIAIGTRELPQVATRILIERIVSRRGGRAPIANRLHHTTTAVEFPRGAPSLWRLLLLVLVGASGGLAGLCCWAGLALLLVGFWVWLADCALAAAAAAR